MIATQARASASLVLAVVGLIAMVAMPESSPAVWSVHYSAQMRTTHGMHLVAWAPGHGHPPAICTVGKEWTTCAGGGDISADSLTGGPIWMRFLDGGTGDIELDELRVSVDFHQL